jgi:hypothetical protein
VSEQEPHAGGEQEQRPGGGTEGRGEQEVAQGERARRRQREVQGGDAEGGENQQDRDGG